LKVFDTLFRISPELLVAVGIGAIARNAVPVNQHKKLVADGGKSFNGLREFRDVSHIVFSFNKKGRGLAVGSLLVGRRVVVGRHFIQGVGASRVGFFPTNAW